MAEPKVRFKRDDGSSYPAWTTQTVGEMTVELTDYKPLGCGLPLLTSSRTGLMFQDEYRSKSSTENDNTLFSVVPRGAVTYRHMSDDNIFHFNINELVDEGLVSKEYPVFNTVNGNDVRLLVEYLNSSKAFLEFCKAQKKGGTRTRLYFKVLKGFEMMFPQPEEQQKITDFLSSVDEVITSSEEEVVNLERQKKAVMKKIFSQEVRFKKADGTDFPEWESTTLGNLEGKVSSGKDKNEDGNVPLYGSMGPIGTCSVATVLGNKILVARVGANAGSVRLVTEDCGVTDNTLIIKDADTCNFCWLYYALVEKDIGKMRFGGGQPLVTGTMLFDLEMDVPCLEEQRLIADFLSDFDEAIAAAKKELDLWKELKKGLLQQMFV